MAFFDAFAAPQNPNASAGRPPRPILQRLVVAAAVALLVVAAASFTPLWRSLEGDTFDLFTALTAPRHSPIPVVVLAIDEPTFQHLGQAWPFPRSMHAQLLERLQADGAAAVGFDVLFSEASREEEDAAFERAIARSSAVVLAAVHERSEAGEGGNWASVQPLERFVRAGAVPGESMVQPDEDFVVRRAFAHPSSFALRVAAMADAEALRRQRGSPPSEFLIYRGPRGTFDTRSYYQAFRPDLLPPGFFRDKIVLVGRSARSAVELGYSKADLFQSPFAILDGERLYPGVELQATLIDNLLTGARLRSAAPGWAVALLLGSAALLVLVARRFPVRRVALTAFLLMVLGLVGSGVLFVQGVWLAPLLPVVGTLAVYMAIALLAYLRARGRERLTRTMFAQYVPRAVVDRLVAQPEQLRLGGVAREVTVMFTDLDHFTTLSEQLTAEQTVELLTAYFNAMTPLVHATGGTVDKFIGDALMAFWGAPLDDPLHAEHAVRTALAMQAAMPALAEQLRERGLPPLQMRIGVHTGRVVVGNVGSVQRFSYTVIGDAVNLAARLEEANKALGTRILVSGATAALLPSDIALQALDALQVKGRIELVQVFTTQPPGQLSN
jgi:adenylate cyclase